MKRLSIILSKIIRHRDKDTEVTRKEGITIIIEGKDAKLFIERHHSEIKKMKERSEKDQILLNEKRAKFLEEYREVQKRKKR